MPSDCIDDERANPGSQMKIASSEGRNGNLFLWGQSVYIISQLLGLYDIKYAIKQRDVREFDISKWFTESSRIRSYWTAFTSS